MRFWQNVQTTAGMAGAFGWVILGFFITVGCLYYLLPGERSRLRLAVFLFLLSMVGIVAASGLLFYMNESSVVYISVRCIALFIQAVAMINVGSALIFPLILQSLGLDTP